MRRADEPAEKLAAERRVIRVLNAIADLNEGDLWLALELDEMTPLMEFGENDTFQLKDGRLLYTPGYPSPPGSLMHKAKTGKALGRMLEQLLLATLGFGEAKLISWQKRNRKQEELGGRRFS